MNTTVINPILTTSDLKANSSQNEYIGSIKSLIGTDYMIKQAEAAEEYFEIQRVQATKTGLKRDLKWPELIMIGIGCTIGAGIFVVTGNVARDKTGPALFLSYIFSGIACLISAFSYAEFAGMVCVYIVYNDLYFYHYSQGPYCRICLRFYESNFRRVSWMGHRYNYRNFKL